MIRKYLFPLLATVGLLIAIVAVIIDNRPKPVEYAAVEPPKAPFVSYVAGTGIIEPSSGNIAVGTPVAGIVTNIYVKWGEHVKTGDRLFKIDDRDLQAQLLPALAKVEQSEAKLEQSKDQLQFAESVPEKRAISAAELNNRRSAVAIDAAGLAAAKAEVERLRLEIERRTIRALVPGQILQVNVRPGEFAPSGVLATPLMVLGGDARLFLRVDIDEYDAWRVRRDAPAEAFVRGNPDLHTALRFERIEPYVAPKASLTGSSTERTDTRVLQVVYSFDPAAVPDTYVGQQMDVFIRTRSSASAPAYPAKPGAGQAAVGSP